MAFPTVTVEIALGVDPTVDYLILDDTERGLLDTGRLAPADGVWTDVSAYVQQVTTSRGRQRLLEQYRTGTCSVVVDNDDGRFSPHNLSGPYVAAGVTQLQPERRIRVRATWSGTTYDLFHGFVDAYSPTWTHPQGSRVTITASDAFKVLGRYDPAAESSPVGAGEATGARVGRLLDLVSWPDGDRDLATGDSTLQATTLAQNVLTGLFLSVDSEMGEVYVDESGKVVFENRHAIFEAARSNTSQASFSDAGGASDVPYFDIEVAPFDADLVKNSVSIARVGGEAQTATDATSIARYFTRTWQRHDLLLESDAECDAYADQIVLTEKDARQRIEGISLRGLSDDTGRGVWPQILGRRLGDRVTVVRTPENGDALDRQVFIAGIDHTINAGRDWVCRFATADATAYAEPGFFVLDHASLGKLDTNALAAF